MVVLAGGAVLTTGSAGAAGADFYGSVKKEKRILVSCLGRNKQLDGVFLTLPLPPPKKLRMSDMTILTNQIQTAQILLYLPRQRLLNNNIYQYLFLFEFETKDGFPSILFLQSFNIDYT